MRISIQVPTGTVILAACSVTEVVYKTVRYSGKERMLRGCTTAGIGTTSRGWDDGSLRIPKGQLRDF